MDPMTPQTTSEDSDLQPNALDSLSMDKRNEIVAWVRNEYRKCKNTRHKVERQWYVNLAFYLGKQNVATVTTATNNTALQTPKVPYWSARPISNKIRPVIRKELAKVTSARPTAFVIPASSEDSDLFAAQAAESLWYSLYDSKDIGAIAWSAEFWTLICGTGYIKTYWDPSATDEVNNMPGDIVIEKETPFHIFIPDVTQEELELQPYLIHASMRTVEWAKLRYGDSLPNTIQPTGSSETIMDTGFLKLIGADDQPLDSVEVVEMWIKPGQFNKFPHGALVTLVGEQLAQVNEGWLYNHGRYPFVKLTHVPTGAFYGESVITDLIPLQKEYNRTKGQVIEAKNRMAKPQLIAPKGSVDPRKITTEPGQVILYRPGFQPPQPLPLQPLPQYVLDELDRLRIDMDDISGQHEVSRGSVPPGVTAATAISYLQEQDDTMLAGTVRSLEKGMEKLARLMLSYVQQYWTAPRMVKVTGVDGSFDVVEFMSSDLAENTDIRIETDSALPTSRSARQAFVMDLMKMGFIDPDKGLEVMEIGGINKLYEQINVDKRQAQRENIRMQQIPPETVDQFMQAQELFKVNQGVNPTTGQPMPPPPPPVSVNTWDNHQVHIQTHNNFRKSQTFEALPDPLKIAFESHVTFHQQALAGLQQQAMMAGMEPQGQGQGPEPQGPPDMNQSPMPEGPQNG